MMARLHSPDARPAPVAARALAGAACALAVLVIWTSFILIARERRHALSPFDIAFLRFSPASLALPLAWRRCAGCARAGRAQA